MWQHARWKKKKKKLIYLFISFYITVKNICKHTHSLVIFLRNSGNMCSQILGETWHKIPQRLNKFSSYLWRQRENLVEIKVTVLESDRSKLRYDKTQVVNTWRHSIKFKEFHVRFVAENNIPWEDKLSQLGCNLINTLYKSREKQQSKSDTVSHHFIIFISHLYEAWGDTTCTFVHVRTHKCTHKHTKQNIHFSPWYFLINRTEMTVITYMINLWQHIPAGHTDNTLKHKWMQQLICHGASQSNRITWVGGSNQQVGSSELQYGR
jgi:hypothetical protein